MSFKCNICVCDFKTNQQYLRHMSSKKHQLRATNNGSMLECIGCKKMFSHSSTLSNHKTKCKILKGTNSLQEQMTKMKAAFEKERAEMKAQIALLLDKHAGTTTTTNHTTNNNIETQNNIHIHINAFGQENVDYLDNKTIIACIDRVYKSIPALIEKLHFDPDHPENHNIRITNKKLPYATVMGDNSKWKTVDRKDAIETMVYNGYNFLDEKYPETKGHLSTRKREHFEGFQNKFESEDKELLKQLKTDIELAVLNG